MTGRRNLDTSDYKRGSNVFVALLVASYPISSFYNVTDDKLEFVPERVSTLKVEGME